MPDKKSRKQESFSGHESTQTAQVRVTFFYPDYTVGLGITPSHALLESGSLLPQIPTASSRTPELLVGCTTDRELHPAPKVKYFVIVIIIHIVGTQ